MTNQEQTHRASYFGNNFTAPGLPVFQRTITGHHDDGKAYFMTRDNGSHQAIRKASESSFEVAQTVLYSTFTNPVNLNHDDDLNAAKHGWQGGHHAKNGTLVTILDFSPGGETAMHRGESIDYNVVLEGEFDLVLDSGEVTRMRCGDVNVQRATNHKWINISGNGTKPGRLFNVLLDIDPLMINGQELKGFFGGFPGPYGFGVERKETKRLPKTEP